MFVLVLVSVCVCVRPWARAGHREAGGEVRVAGRGVDGGADDGGLGGVGLVAGGVEELPAQRHLRPRVILYIHTYIHTYIYIIYIYIMRERRRSGHPLRKPAKELLPFAGTLCEWSEKANNRGEGKRKRN